MNCSSFTSFPSIAPPNPSCSLLFGTYNYDCPSKPNNHESCRSPVLTSLSTKASEKHPEPVPPNAPRLPIYTISFPISSISLVHEKRQNI
ncbi:hypothetical protein HMI54_014131 [Coelomomyces lativittatus]|nr:hypothetical protein HMI56_002060 [Coelomomyces lativittatus]KAJ1518172.1 hypothetical protein HMI55_002057 [Coelomomyces lativittatus]KAJ1518628.1 hypothetical protein HMI54_014131 [Coelomomyces lativittatus]